MVLNGGQIVTKCILFIVLKWTNSVPKRSICVVELKLLFKELKGLELGLKIFLLTLMFYCSIHFSTGLGDIIP
jgi:hypothetical protein